MIERALQQVVERRDLTLDEAHSVMSEIMAGECTPAQIAGLLVGLRMKGETADEVAGFARGMRESCLRVHPSAEGLVDTCGTGGDALDTFNVSTAAALVAAGAGVPIAKHGNRAVTSRCGSADVLRELGLNLELTAEQVGWSIDEVGIGFLFAPYLHPAMSHALGPRRELGLRTVFNVLGPLTNPAGAARQVVGVFGAEWVSRIATALVQLGVERALVVHGLDGLDELSTLGPSLVCEVRDGDLCEFEVTPEQFGLTRASVADIAGSDPATSAQQVIALLEGERGARREIVLLNAAAAIFVGGLAESIEEGLVIAAQSVDSGAARRTLRAMVRFSHGE
ncbi:MAG: anthranilate phosphoribosyltransferase [Armatimonadetes bacterium]|nr:anthranilate phosphoribosyltransferase [Armatimonadota bacterium]